MKAECNRKSKLWFDVEKKTITTKQDDSASNPKLWFDVEKKTITTDILRVLFTNGCGLM